jgi:hypothetical protein
MGDGFLMINLAIVPESTRDEKRMSCYFQGESGRLIQHWSW